ncbi:glycosyltransferase family 4 protein [Terriglobus roseus]|uniref:Glycosyltransferase involved in cell wall bisynthesis n=1 Tax=Terriglobus roseus TaxID=392734 RepID=A0A1G7NC78_9BACT|nr:glycosyltransferase family 1 protein [Terriglobus roseus]SDF71541.1 Glycosyltransferase involved in cell wall bisynthesis [Terriglobus roseus]
MRVLIDATGLTKRKAGVGVYGKELIDGLVASNLVQLYLVVQDDDPDLAYYPAAVTVLRMPSRFLRKVPLRIIFEQTVLPFLIRKYRVDVVHSLHYSFPIFRFGAKSAVTIHDMTSLSMPEVHIGIKLRYYRFFIRRAQKWSDGLIFVSRSAQEDFVSHLGPPRGLSTVVYHGKSPAFHPLIDRTQIEPLCVKYGLPERYILYVGTVEPRKNLERLVEAFASLASALPTTSLVIAGMMGWKQEHLTDLVHAFGLEDRVIFTGYVAEEEKPVLIAGSDLFVYPSLYEGFGLPVLEALACGVPTITSDVSSLPEVAGDAALLIDPKDTRAITKAIEAVMGDPVLAAGLREKGPEQAAKFTWERAATQTAAVYSALYSR